MTKLLKYTNEESAVCLRTMVVSGQISLHGPEVDILILYVCLTNASLLCYDVDNVLEHSPVPSLVSSPTPPLHHQDLPSPRQSPPPLTYSRQGQHSQRRYSKSSTAGSVLVTTTSTTATSITPNGKTNKRRRGNLPKAVTAILRDWLSDHKKHPYPTEDEKDYLANRTGLTLNQISNWFINARRRILQPMLEQENEHQNELDILPYETPHHHHSTGNVPLLSLSSPSYSSFFLS